MQLMSAVIESRPTLVVSPDTPGILLPNGNEKIVSPYSTVREARIDHQIIFPQEVFLGDLLGRDRTSQFELTNGETWAFTATPSETFMGTTYKDMMPPADFTYKHMFGFVKYLEYWQVKERQLGNGDDGVDHAKVAHFLAGNWHLPRATEIEMPGGNMLDFAGLLPKGKVAVVDSVSAATRESDIKAKMLKLHKIYVPQLKRMHREAYGVSIRSSFFIPYVITYDFSGDIKSVVAYDDDDVREFQHYLSNWDSIEDEKLAA